MLRFAGTPTRHGRTRQAIGAEPAQPCWPSRHHRPVRDGSRQGTNAGMTLSPPQKTSRATRAELDQFPGRSPEPSVAVCVVERPPVSAPLPSIGLARYASDMGSPSNAPDPHDRLVRELAELPASERRAVFMAAVAAASGSSHRVTASWQSIRAAIGIVKGAPADAIEDTAHLYDG